MSYQRYNRNGYSSNSYNGVGYNIPIPVAGPPGPLDLNLAYWSSAQGSMPAPSPYPTCAADTTFSIYMSFTTLGEDPSFSYFEVFDIDADSSPLYLKMYLNSGNPTVDGLFPNTAAYTNAAMTAGLYAYQAGGTEFIGSVISGGFAGFFGGRSYANWPFRSDHTHTWTMNNVNGSGSPIAKLGIWFDYFLTVEDFATLEAGWEPA